MSGACVPTSAVATGTLAGALGDTVAGAPGGIFGALGDTDADAPGGTIGVSEELDDDDETPAEMTMLMMPVCSNLFCSRSSNVTDFAFFAACRARA